MCNSSNIVSAIIPKVVNTMVFDMPLLVYVLLNMREVSTIKHH